MRGCNIENTLSEFLDSHWDERSPLLLAFSGGPDSLALLHLLNDYRKTRPLKMALAHVDHGWREESREEARQIACMAAHLGLELHSTRLEPAQMSGNLEAACREARLLFFADLCAAHHYQAVLLAHHADDLAETVLKRMFEGSSLSCLCGLRPEVDVLGVRLWRPLLSLTKEDLGQWLEARKLVGFDDRTNRDPRFLRARFRSTIIPQLSREFGKQVSPALRRIGCEAAELRCYLDHKIAPYLSRISRSKLGLFLDLSQDCPEAMLEIKHLIRSCCESDEFSIGRECIETAADLLRRGVADKQVLMGDKKVFIDRMRLFVLGERELPRIPAETVPLKEGAYDFGQWKVQVNFSEKGPNNACSSWQAFWQNGGEVTLPHGEYHLGASDLNIPYPRSSPLGKWWTNHKIPAFLRHCVPVIYAQGEMIHEFLSGKMLPRKSSEKGGIMKISIYPL